MAAYTKQTVGIGVVPGDNQGDSARTAFTKLNDNFDVLFSAFNIDSITFNATFGESLTILSSGSVLHNLTFEGGSFTSVDWDVGFDSNTASSDFTIRQINAASDRLRLNTSGNAIFSGGVAFSGDTAIAANLLDDYEEGTFSVTVEDSSGNAATHSSLCQYTKQGNTVTYDIRATLTSKGSMVAGDQVKIIGLPFTTKAGHFPAATFAQGTSLNITQFQGVHGVVLGNTVIILLRTWRSTGGDDTFTVSSLTATSDLILSGTYRV